MKYIKLFEFEKKSLRLSSELIEATSTGNLKKVKELIDYGVDVNVQNEIGETALIIATYQDRRDIVKCLIEAGTDVNIKNKGGYTSLMQASYHNNITILKQLIDAGADVNSKNDDGRSALYFAISENFKRDNYRIIKVLLDNGSEYNISDLFESVNNFVSNGSREKLKIDFPEKYEEYLIYKDAKKYNL